MGGLEHLQPGTAWALMAAVAVVIIGAVVIVALMPAKNRRIPIGNLKADADGQVRIKKASLADEEIVRIAKQIAAEMGHTCIQRPLLVSIAGLAEPLSKTAIALADEAIERGKNGLIKEGRQGIVEGLAAYREYRDEQVVV